MERTGKVAFVYATRFWKDSGFSGTVFSDMGPLKQIWDNSNIKSKVSAELASESSNSQVSYKNLKAKELIGLIDTRKLNRAGLSEKSELIQLLVLDDPDGEKLRAETAPNTYALAGFVFNQDLALLKDEATIRRSILPQLVSVFGDDAANPIQIYFKSWAHDEFTHDIGDGLVDENPRRNVPFGSPLARHPHGRYAHCIHTLYIFFIDVCIFIPSQSSSF